MTTFLIVSILLIDILSTQTLLSPTYGSGSLPITEHIALNQGRIYSIQNWAVSPSKLGTRIQLGQWYADNQTIFTDYGTGTNHKQCEPFELSMSDYIIGYRIWVDDDIYGLEFHSRNGNLYSCIGDDSKPSFANSYYYATDDFWYLTGWKIESDAIIDQIQFQFTKAIIIPTPDPTPHPTDFPTSDPTLFPSQSPTNIPSIPPTLSPTVNRSTQLPYNITNGCVTKDDNDVIYILGGYGHMLNDIYSAHTDDILVWNTSTSEIANRFGIYPWNMKPKSSINCHQNTVYSSIMNEIYIAGALSVYWYRTGRFNASHEKFIYVTSTYYMFNVSTLQYTLFSPDGSKGNQRLIRSCTSLMQFEDDNLLLTFGGQSTDDFEWVKDYQKHEFKLKEMLDTSYNTTNKLQIFNLSNHQWIENNGSKDAPLSMMESACIAMEHNLFVIGGKTVINDDNYARSEILRCAMHYVAVIFIPLSVYGSKTGMIIFTLL